MPYRRFNWDGLLPCLSYNKCVSLDNIETILDMYRNDGLHFISCAI